MSNHLRDYIRKVHKIPREVNFYDSTKVTYNPHFLNYEFRKFGNFSVIEYIFNVDRFTKEFMNYCKQEANGGKAYFMVVGYHQGIPLKYLGAILEFDFSSHHSPRVTNIKMKAYDGTIVEIDRIKEYKKHTNITWEDLLFMKDYRDGAKSNFDLEQMSLVDKFHDPLNIGDVVILKNLEIGIIEYVNPFAIIHKEIPHGEYGDLMGSTMVQKSVSPSCFADFIKVGKTKCYYYGDVIKAPEHVKSKIIEWKLSN